MDRAEEVHAHHLVEVRGLARAEQGVARDARRADEHVRRSQTGDQLLASALDVVPSRHIAAEELRADTEPRSLFRHP